MLDRLTKLGIEQRFPDQAALRARIGKFYFRPPGGESWCDVILRLRSVLDTVSLHYSHPGSRVLVVGHQVIVLCLRYLIEELTEEEILAIDERRGRELRGDVVHARPERGAGRTAAPRRVQLRRAAGGGGGAGDVASRRTGGREVRRKAARAIAVTRALLRKRCRCHSPTTKERKTNAAGAGRGRVGAGSGRGATRRGSGAARRRGEAPAGDGESSAAALGMAVPEALVVALPEARSGETRGSSRHRRCSRATRARWMRCSSGRACRASGRRTRCSRRLVGRLRDDATLILDAAGDPRPARPTRRCSRHSTDAPC